jgi:hypothetical protein
MIRSLRRVALVPVALVAFFAIAWEATAAGPVVNPLTDSNVYPIAVWAMGSRTAPAFAAMGVNIFVGGESGNAAAWCDELAKSGCVGFVGWRNRSPEQLAQIAASPGFLGWMHGDEPDNAGEVNGEFRSTATPPAELIARYQAMKASKAPAPMYLNLGQGLANANWQSTPDEMYKDFMKCADVVCYDVYPTSTMPDGANRLILTARGVSRLKAFAGKDRPAWIWLECTNMPADKADVGERAPYPHELRAEVWMSVLHGADGIGYFPHQFNPYKGGPEAIPPELQKEIKLTDSLLHKLAPVLRTGKKEMLKVDNTVFDRVDAAVWTHTTGSLVLAVNMCNGPAKEKIALPAGDMWRSLKVVGQDRDVRVEGGVISDEFKPYEVKLYWTGPKVEGLDYAYPILPVPAAASRPSIRSKIAELPDAQEAGKGLLWSRTHNTVLEARILDEAPQIDGNLTDKAWAGATTLVNWSNVEGTGVADVQTTGWIGQRDGKMYMAFRCQEPNLDKVVTGKKAGWQNDCIEIWFDPTNDRKSYSHIVVAADGTVEASRTIPDEWAEGVRDDGWKPTIQVKTGREEKAWTAELAIEIKALHTIPYLGELGELGPQGKKTLWGFNVARERKPGGGENSMFCCGGFNKSFRFAELDMVPGSIAMCNGVLGNRTDKPVEARLEMRISKKAPGIAFANWDAKWPVIANEIKYIQLAPGQTVNLLDKLLEKKVPIGGLLRLTVGDNVYKDRLLVLKNSIAEEFIANSPPAAGGK